MPGFRKLIRLTVYSRFRALTSGREIARYLETTREAKVNIGCGKNFPQGWLNTDLYPHFGAVWMNAARPWPIPDGSLSACLCEHMIEHVPKDIARSMMMNAFRALKPGGYLRVVTPELDAFARMTLNPDAPDTADYIAGLRNFAGSGEIDLCDAVNQIFYDHGHCHIYTIDALSRMLKDIGFADLQFARGGHYVSPVFEGVDGHPRAIGARMNEIEAFAIEARKPAE
jgi:SAM-dependent methyltransferase